MIIRVVVCRGVAVVHGSLPLNRPLRPKLEDRQPLALASDNPGPVSSKVHVQAARSTQAHKFSHPFHTRGDCCLRLRHGLCHIPTRGVEIQRLDHFRPQVLQELPHGLTCISIWTDALFRWAQTSGPSHHMEFTGFGHCWIDWRCERGEKSRVEAPYCIGSSSQASWEILVGCRH